MPVTKEHLSAGAGGVPVLIAATATPGTTIHTTGTADTTRDEVTLMFSNEHTADVTVTVEWAGTGTVNRITRTVPFRSGLELIIPGIPLSGTGAAGRSIAAFASVANVVSAHGYVNRIAP